MMATIKDDPILKSIVAELVSKYKCHTVILYGSRARGDVTPFSDYDVVGIRRKGKNLRVARKKKGFYLDLTILPEREFRKIGENFLYLKGAKVLFEKTKFGSRLIRKLDVAFLRPFIPLARDEIVVRRMWAYKMLERIKCGDVEALYRRSWLQMALLEDYFAFRGMRYCGSKEAFQWLRKFDKSVYRLFENSLKQPHSHVRLTNLVKVVVR